MNEIWIVILEWFGDWRSQGAYVAFERGGLDRDDAVAGAREQALADTDWAFPEDLDLIVAFRTAGTPARPPRSS